MNHPPTSPDGTTPDELTARIAAALRSREPDDATTAAVVGRVAARLATADDAATAAATTTPASNERRGSPGAARQFVRRAGSFAAAGVLTSTAAVAGAGMAAAANPYTEFAVAVEDVARAAGLDWSAMPEGYTREQYDAFWSKEYSGEDLGALMELWSLDETETKARAGQLILDGEKLPFEPGEHTAPEPTEGEMTAYEAFFDAGYDEEDLRTLIELWDLGRMETKARAGQMVLDGKELPLP